MMNDRNQPLLSCVTETSIIPQQVITWIRVQKTETRAGERRKSVYVIYEFYRIDSGCHISTAHKGMPYIFEKVKPLCEIGKFCVKPDISIHIVQKCKQMLR